MLLLASFLTSLGTLAMLLSSFVTKQKWINVLSFLLLFWAFIQTFMTSQFAFALSPTNPAEFFDDKFYAPTASQGTLYFMSCLPWFHFQRVLFAILQKTKVQGWEGVTIPNSTTEFFSWNDLFEQPFIEVTPSLTNPTPTNFTTTAVSTNVYCLMLLTFVFLCLTYYVCEVAFRGQKFYFMFTKEFYGFKSPPSYIGMGDTITQLQEQSRKEGTVILHKLSKSFATTTAVREMTLTMDNGR